MEEVRYMISDAAKQVEVESHVLRYWQKELDLPISRNEMEQRYYKESDIEMLKRVKHLKEQGFQLKAIKMILSNLNQTDMAETDTLTVNSDEKVMELFYMEKPSEDNISMDKLSESKEGTSLISDEESREIKGDNESKLGQFMAIMNHMIQDALRENNGILSDEISANVSDGVISRMNYLMRVQEEKEEERFRKFDATLREYQKSKLLSAATTDKNRKKSKFLSKNRIHI